MIGVWKKLKQKDEEYWQSKGMRNWEYRRQQGKTSYIWRFVLLTAFIPPFANAIMVWVKANGFTLRGTTPEGLYADLITWIISGTIAAWIVGSKTWKRMERRYARTLGTRQSQPEQ